jgi:hypothetical protein
MSCIASVYQGDDLRLIINVKDCSRSYVDISGATEITWSIARSVNSPALLTKTLTGGGVQIGNNHALFLDLTDTETAALPTGSLYQEVEIINGSGLKATLHDLEALRVKPALI